MSFSLFTLSRAFIFWLFVFAPIINVFIVRGSEEILCAILIFIGFYHVAEKNMMESIQKIYPALKTPLGLAFLTFTFWALFACAWSYNPKAAFLSYFPIFGLLALCYVLTQYFVFYPFKKIQLYLIYSLIVACIVFCIVFYVVKNYSTPLNAIYRHLSVFNRPASGFWVLAVPLFMHAPSRGFQFLLLTALLLMTFFTISSSSALAAFVFVLGGICVYFAPIVSFHAVMGIVVTFVLTAPLVAKLPLKGVDFITPYFKLGASSLHRTLIWDNYATLVSVKPWAGWGFNSSRLMLENPELTTIALNDPAQNIGMHPHNHGLQLWVEFGLIGVLIFCVAWVLLWKKLNVLNLSKKPFATLFIAIIFAMSCVNYSLWQGWWIAYIGFGIALFHLPKNILVSDSHAL
jgi:O-antigen ligase